MVRVVQVSKCNGLGRTDLGAGRDIILLSQFPSALGMGLIPGMDWGVKKPSHS